MEYDDKDHEMLIMIGRHKGEAWNSYEVTVGEECETMCKRCIKKCSVSGENRNLILTRIFTGRLLEQPDLCPEMIAKINKYKML